MSLMKSALNLFCNNYSNYCHNDKIRFKIQKLCKDQTKGFQNQKNCKKYFFAEPFFLLVNAIFFTISHKQYLNLIYRQGNCYFLLARPVCLQEKYFPALIKTHFKTSKLNITNSNQLQTCSSVTKDLLVYKRNIFFHLLRTCLKTSKSSPISNNPKHMTVSISFC